MNSQSNLSPASPGASLFAETLAEQRAQQFRMRRLQVHNWGTFNGLTEVPIAEKGFLFVGRSGSGKSTLLDAMSALLTPPSIVDFNAAAREAERSGRDRSLVSYVRGAWADQQDSASGEIATQYLRKGATWTALVLEYRNAQGEAVSLVRLFWIAGSGNAAADVRRHYMVVPRAFDVASELEGFDLDLRKLKARLGEDVAHFDGFAGYAERFRHALGIGNDMALRLLHKTQSAKNLGDLNAFLRGFMLDEPRTFEAADRLVEDFAELDGAHHAVVTARRQVETLSPAREHHAALMALRRSVGELRELQLGVDSYREQQRLALLEARLQEVDSQDRGLAGEEGQRRESLDNHERNWPGWSANSAPPAVSRSKNSNASACGWNASAMSACVAVRRSSRPAASSAPPWRPAPVGSPPRWRMRRECSMAASSTPAHWTRPSPSAWVNAATMSAALPRSAPSWTR